MNTSNDSKKKSFEEILADRLVAYRKKESVLMLGISLVMTIIFIIIIYTIYSFNLFDNKSLSFIFGVVSGIVASVAATFISIYLRNLKESKEALLMDDKTSNQDLLRRIECHLNQKLKKEE
jgi:uncharacterized membrane protein